MGTQLTTEGLSFRQTTHTFLQTAPMFRQATHTFLQTAHGQKLHTVPLTDLDLAVYIARRQLRLVGMQCNGVDPGSYDIVPLARGGPKIPDLDRPVLRPRVHPLAVFLEPFLFL